MRWESGVIDGGTNLNSLAASFTLVLGNSRLELVGDACGISDVWVGLGLHQGNRRPTRNAWGPGVICDSMPRRVGRRLEPSLRRCCFSCVSWMFT